jgi:two-component system, response regulator RegA
MGRTLLIVEDRSVSLRVVRSVFESRDFEILSANSLAEARFVVRERQVDVCLLDIELPDGVGLCLIEPLRAAGTRVVLFSSGLTVHLAWLAAREWGVAAIVTRPATRTQLLHAVEGEEIERTQASELHVKTSYRMSLARIEREYISQLLAYHGGNITKTAASLGLHRQSLQRKLRKLLPDEVRAAHAEAEA